jgi:hypothetical protein
MNVWESCPSLSYTAINELNFLITLLKLLIISGMWSFIQGNKKGLWPMMKVAPSGISYNNKEIITTLRSYLTEYIFWLLINMTPDQMAQKLYQLLWKLLLCNVSSSQLEVELDRCVKSVYIFDLMLLTLMHFYFIIPLAKWSLDKQGSLPLQHLFLLAYSLHYLASL